MAATRSLSTEIGIKPACDAWGLVRSGFYRGQRPVTAPAPRTLSPEESIRSQNSWRPPQIEWGPGISQNSWAP